MSAVVATTESSTRIVPLTKAVELNPRPDRGALADDLEVSFVPMAAVEAGTGRMDASEVRSFGKVKKGYTVFRDGDVLFAKITPCMENGKMVVARGLRNGVGCGSTEFHVLRPRPEVDPLYVYYFVSSARFRAEAAHHMTGAVGQKRVPALFLERSRIPLPGLGDQRRIVAEIEKQFSRLDEAIANLKRVTANFKRYRTTLLAFAAAGRLAAGELDTIRLNRKETSEPPAGWKWVALGELGQVIGGLTKNPKRAMLRKKLPYLRVANVHADELRLDDIETIGVTEEELPKLELQRGDLLIVEGNGSAEQIGRVAIWDGSISPCVHQNHLIKVRLRDCEPRWVLNWLLSPAGRQSIREVASSTSGLYTLSVGKVSRLPVPVPPRSEQQRVVAEVDRLLSINKKMAAQTNNTADHVNALRQAILSRAFAQWDSAANI